MTRKILPLRVAAIAALSILIAAPHAGAETKTKRYVQLEARQCPSNCDRMRENAARHAAAWCTGLGVKKGAEPFEYKCRADGNFCRVTGRITCNAEAQNEPGWYYALKSTSTPQDRETELTRIAKGRFKRIDGTHVNTNWHTVCGRVNLACKHVRSWDTQTHDCGGGAHDGSRMALCE
jgi:hypothetical protein